MEMNEQLSIRLRFVKYCSYSLLRVRGKGSNCHIAWGGVSKQERKWGKRGRFDEKTNRTKISYFCLILSHSRPNQSATEYC